MHMANFESTPRNNNEQTSEVRASKAIAFEREDYYSRGTTLEDLSKEHREVQAKIAELEATLGKGNELAANERNPKLRELSIELGREITHKLEPLREKKEDLEKKIRNAGGNVSDYTVQ